MLNFFPKPILARSAKIMGSPYNIKALGLLHRTVSSPDGDQLRVMVIIIRGGILEIVPSTDVVFDQESAN